MPTTHAYSAQPPPIVLVVDDDASIQRALTRVLQMHSFAPLQATSIAEAVQTAEQHPLDAVILDLGLRGAESGIDFLAWMRQQPQYQTTPILILTGRSELGEDDEALIRRNKAYVFYKPESFTTLATYLTRLVAQPPAVE